MSSAAVQSGFEFASPGEALGVLLERITAVGVEQAPLAGAAGRVLAEAAAADRPSPAADVSAMDGYAVRLADLSADELPVAGEVSIGQRPPALRPGTAVRIVTGGGVPEGAEAVIRREDVREVGGGAEGRGAHCEISDLKSEISDEHGKIVLTPAARGVAEGASIRYRGENIGAGEEVVADGSLVTPAVVAALAAFGVSRPAVHRRLTVGVVVTGDEVLSELEAAPEGDGRDGAGLSDWQLRDSNGPALAAMLSGPRWIGRVIRGRCDDDPARLRECLGGMLGSCDVLFVTGGVSMGQRDFVPAALRELGAEVLFHRLPQRPGKPVLAAVSADGRPVLALPGNPVSVMVTARRLGGAVLRKLAGFARPEPVPKARLGAADGKTLDLWWHRPVRLTGAGVAELIQTRGSGDIPGTAGSDGFVEVPPGETGPGPWPFYSWMLT